MRALQVLREPRVVSAEPLNVAPELVGRVLATPARRASAMGIDLLVVALLAQASGWWLALALLLLAARLRGALVQEGARRVVTTLLLAVVVAAAAWTAFDAWRGSERQPRAAQTESRAELPQGATDRQRLDRAEAELEQARAELQRRTLADQLEATLDDWGASFGWGIVYFSLLPAWWHGRTLGKRLLGLRIVELTGKPITPLRGLKRYGGYAAGMATGGLGFLQMLWEPNRQGLQDKAAHTVVLDERSNAPAIAPHPPVRGRN
jgi:RDD family